MRDICPFCGCDPYHYEDVGLGGRGVPVAITCCELGMEWFKRREEMPDSVTVGWDDFERIAQVFAGLRALGLQP